MIFSRKNVKIDVSSERSYSHGKQNKGLLTKYQYILAQLQKIGDKYKGSGYFPDKDVPFFEEKGCEVENYDFGIETFEVEKVSDEPIKRSR